MTHNQSLTPRTDLPVQQQLQQSLAVSLETGNSSKIKRFVQNQNLPPSQQAFPIPVSLDYCPMTPEEIQQHSLLQKSIPVIEKLPNIKETMKTSSQEQAVLEVAGHFIGAGLITGGNKKVEGGAFNLEGMLDTPCFVIWNYLLENLRKHSLVPQKIIHELEQGINQFLEFNSCMDELINDEGNEKKLYECALKYAKKISNLKAAESVLMSGGWLNVGGGSGHALIYEFKRNNDQTLDVYIYTSTNFQLAHNIFIGDKLRLKPIIRYANIPEHKVLFNQDNIVRPIFIQHLMELIVLAKWETDRTVEQKDILEAFDQLFKYHKSGCWEEMGAITGQRAGTCVVASSKVWIRRLCGRKDTYKQLMFHVKFLMMIGSYQSLKLEISKDTNRGALSRRLLLLSARNLVRSIAKLIAGVDGSQPLINKKASTEAQATAYHLIQILGEKEEKIKKNRIKSSYQSNLLAVDRKKQKNTRKNFFQKLKISKADRSNVPVGQHVLSDEKYLFSPSEIIDQLIQILKRQPYINKQLFNLELHRLVDQLKIPIMQENGFRAEFWESSTVNQKQDVLYYIEKLSCQYAKSSMNDIPERRYATILPLYCITHYLALEIDASYQRHGKANLSFYKIPQRIYWIHQLEGLVFYNRNHFLRTKNALEYFQSFEKNAKGPVLFETEDSSSIEKYEIKKSPGNGVYWQALMESDQKFKKHVKNLANAEWKELTKDEIRTKYKTEHAVYIKNVKEFRSQPQNFRSKNSPPQEPFQQVNLPEKTKYSMILEAGVHPNCSLFEGFGKTYQHIACLRIMTHRVGLWLTQEKITPDLEACSLRIALNSLSGTVLKGGSPKKISKEYQESVLKQQHRAMNAEENAFFTQPQTLRQIALWKRDIAEGNTLSKKRGGPVTLNDRLLRTLSEWKLTPYQLISEFSTQLNLLKSPSIQALFFRLFFRSPVNKNGQMFLGTGQIIVDDDALLINAMTFIEKGLNHFLISGNQDNLQGARFFLELSFYLSKYLRDAGKDAEAEIFNKISFINTWLKSKKPQVKESAVLHYYRMLSYAISPHNFNIHRLVPLFESWIAYNFNPDDGKWKSPVLRLMASNTAAKVASKLSKHSGKDQKFWTALGNGIIKALAIDTDYQPMNWHYDIRRPNLIQTNTKDKHWTIDLVSGTVYNSLGRIGCGDGSHPWEQQKDFKRLFSGNTNFSYLEMGRGHYIFKHPEFGIMRLIRDKGFYAIQRQFPELGKGWFESKNEWREDLYSDNKNPTILADDHLFWKPVSCDDKTQETIEGYITTLKDHRVCFVAYADGSLREIMNRRKSYSRFVYYLDAQQKSNTPSPIEAIQRFDLKEHILCYSKAGCSKPEELIFPRYTSLEGNRLVFRDEKCVMVWSENTEYFIPQKMPTGHFGTISNYLYLQSKKNPQSAKLLVPFQKINSESIPIPEGSLDIANRTPLNSEPTAEQWDQYKYFVYTIRNGNIEPTSTESKLFLAYIDFSQKNYSKTIEALRSLPAHEALSPISSLILKLIIALPVGEHHPDAIMVHFQALLLKIQKINAVSTTVENPYFGGDTLTEPEIKGLWKVNESFVKLQGSLNNVTYDCKFTLEEEKTFLDALIKELKRRESQLLKLSNIFYSRFSDKIKQLDRRLQHLKSLKKETRQPLVIDSSRFVYNYRKKTYFSEMPKLINLQEIDKCSEKLTHSVSWLDEGSSSTLLVSRLSKNSFKIGRNGKLLMEICHIAAAGPENERRARAYQLAQWRLHNEGWDEHDYSLIDLMLAILIHSKHFFPEGLEKHTTPDEKYFFILHLRKKYTEATKIPIPSDYQELLPIINKVHYKRLPDPKRIDLTNLQKDRSYPIPTKSFFDNPEKKLSDFGQNPNPINIKLENPSTRWRQLDKWKEQLTKQEKISHSSLDFQLKFDESLLSKKEKIYRGSLKIDFELLREEYRAGTDQHTQKIQWNIAKKESQILTARSLKTKEDNNKKIQKLKTELLTLANTKSSNKMEREAENAKIGGTVAKMVTYKDCVQALLSMDQRAFTLLNKNLNSSRLIEEICQRTLEIADFMSYNAQLSRIADLSSKIANIRDERDPTRQYLCQQLHSNLDAKYHFEGFDLNTQVALRIFSGQTGMLPYKKQTDLIMKMLEKEEQDVESFKDIVIQLIMGGGKTSVIATIILYLSAIRKNSLSVFIVPASLYQTVQANISLSMGKAFGKNIKGIDVGREALTSHKLLQILQTLEHADTKAEPIIIKAATLQCFELEMISKARQIARIQEEFTPLKKSIRSCEEKISKIQNTKDKTTDYQRDQKKHKQTSQHLSQLKNTLEKRSKELKYDLEKLQLLIKICKKFPTYADGLLDEVDLILDSLQEVNFPDGDTIRIAPSTNALILHVYQSLVSDTLKIKTLQRSPSVSDIVRLKDNQQTLMDQSIYIEHVVPVVALNLYESFKPIKECLQEGYKESFIRYASGILSSEIQELVDHNILVSPESLSKQWKDWNTYGSCETIQQDVDFLKNLQILHKSTISKMKEAAGLIALARHVLCELTPATLSKSGRRNYGPSPKSKSLTIVPYLSVNVPATTQFGYYLEEACYYYQWAAAFPVNVHDVEQMARISESTARYYVEKNGEIYEDTPEYKDFKEKFNCTIEDAQNPKKLQAAVLYISRDASNRLNLQYEIIAQKVAFRSERLSSNGMNLLRQLKSRRAMSGTPWNVQGYDKKLYDRFMPDKGTEGVILHALAKRENKGSLHKVDFSTIEQFMEQTLGKHQNPNRVRGIIEAGGLFKLFRNNAEVAKGLMKYISKKQKDGFLNQEIEGVLFFHKDHGQLHADTLYVWRRGADNPERIGSTSQAALLAKGLNPSKYFVSYDERHTTGVDILQKPDAINLFTFDEEMIRRTIGQGLMRLRQFLFAQNVEVVVTKETCQKLFNKGQTLNDFVISAEKNQSIRKTKNMVHYFKQQINAIFRHQAVKAILFSKPDDLGHILAWCEPFIVTKNGNDLYQMYGKIQKNKKTKEMLIAYLERQYATFVSQAGNNTEVQKEIKLLKAHILESTCLPESWTDATDEIGIEQEAEVQIQVQVQAEAEVEQEIENEVELELQRYEQMRLIELRRESEFSRREFLELINHIKSPILYETANVIRLTSQLRKFHYGLFEQAFQYEEIFSTPIYGTKAFFYSCKGEGVLPIFHRVQKPPKQILAVKTKSGINWLLLTEHEANSARLHLKSLYNDEFLSNSVDGVWLIQPDGTLLVNGKYNEVFPSEEDAVTNGLFEINVLAGHAHYLDKYPDDLKAWINNQHTDLKIHFLKLRTARDKHNHKILRRNPIIMRIDKNSKHQPQQYVLKVRTEMENSRQGKFIPTSPLDAKLLAPKKIKDLNIQYVKFLGIDPSKKSSDPLTKQALKSLTIKKIDPFAFTRKQFRRLQPFQVSYLTKEQIQWLPVHLVKYIEKKEQIFSEGIYYLTSEQFNHIQLSQAHLIPFLNPDFYSQLIDSCFIQKVPLEHVAKVNPALMKYLTSEQFQFLNQLGPKKINWSPFIGERVLCLGTRERYKNLHGNFLDFIPGYYLDTISQKHIVEITDTALISKFEKICLKRDSKVKKGTWTRWILPEMVPHIDFSLQLKYLEKREHVAMVPDKHIPKLDAATQVPLIKETQVKHLQGKKQVQACPDNLVPYLTPDQVPLISEEQIKFLQGKEQVQACPDTFVPRMTNRHVPHLTSQQSKLLTPEQIKQLNQEDEWNRLDDKQFQFVNPDLVKDFSDALVSRIESNESAYPLAARVKLDQLHLLSNQHVTTHVTDETIEKMQGPHFSKFTPYHPLWNRVKPQAIADLDPKFVGRISHDKIQYLNKKEQVRAINFWNVQHLTKEQLKYRSWKQCILYTIGVITLGVVSSIIALLAYISLIPLITLLINREKGRKFCAKINANPKRLYRYFHAKKAEKVPVAA